MVNYFNDRVNQLMKKHITKGIAGMLWALIEDVEAGNFDCIFVNDFLGHFTDDQVVQLLQIMSSWLRGLRNVGAIRSERNETHE